MISIDRKYIISKEVKPAGRAAYKFYRQRIKTKRNIKKADCISLQSDHTKIIYEFWKEVSKQLIESVSGVYVYKMGYLAIFMSPHKRKYIGRIGDKVGFGYNDHTDHYSFHPMFYSDVVRGSPFRHWRMDYMFNRTWIKRRLYKELLSGRKYKHGKSMLKHINRKKKWVSV